MPRGPHSEARAELTERAESTLREQLERERERAADLITKYPAYGGSFSDREIALKKVRGQASGCEE